MARNMPEYVQCVQCGHVYQWIYNEECPNCKCHVELTLEEYHKQMAIVEQQYAEHEADYWDGDDSQVE